MPLPVTNVDIPRYPGQLSQLINGLTVGTSYLLTFDFALAHQSGYVGANYDNYWQVGFGKATQNSTKLSIPDDGFSGWKSATMAFTPTSASEMLSFLARGTAPGAPPFMLLNNVALNAEVPEPSTWPMLLGGLGLIGWFGVRHDGPNAELRHNLAYYFLSSLVPIVLLSVPMALLGALAAWLVPDALITAIAGLPLAVRMVLAFVIAETGFYWGHRFSHELPWQRRARRTDRAGHVLGLLHPCQPALALRPARVARHDAGLSSLAPQPARALQPQRRVHAAVPGPPVWQPLPAAPLAGRSRDRHVARACVDAPVDRATVAGAASQTGGRTVFLKGDANTTTAPGSG